MKNLLLLLILLLPIHVTQLIAQVSTFRTIKGIVFDQSNEAMIFVTVQANGCNVFTTTDLDGRFKIEIPDSCKTLQFNYTGYQGLIVTLGELDSLTVVMNFGISLDEVIITSYKIPLIKSDNTTLGGIKTGEQFRNLPTKNVNAIPATTAGTNSKRSKSKATNYYVDGIRVSGQPTSNPPVSSVPNGLSNTEDYDIINENIFHSPQDAPLSTFSIDVDAASYANMRRYIAYGQMPPKDAIRIEEMVNYFDYDYPQPHGDTPFAILSEVGVCPWNPSHKLVHLGLQGKEIPTADLPASNLVFLLDVSGSMNEPNKLPLVISSFKILTEQLRVIDRVAIVVYAGSSGLVLPSTTGNNKAEIYAALEKLRAGGSTGGAAGIKLAYVVARQNFIKGGNNRVILATDGDFNVGVSSDGELVELIEKERENDIFLTVLGFGMGNYKDNKMQKLADHGNGNHGYVDNISEAQKVFVHEFGGTLFTIAKDVKIQVEFNPAVVAAYRLIGYENRLLENEDFNDDKKDAGEIGSGHSVTALYEIIPVNVESVALRSVDELKYQKVKMVKTGIHSDEMMTVKFRYKEPEGDSSKLIVHVIGNEAASFESTSKNFRWSSAVALFGMLLRESEFASGASVQNVESWASGAADDDKYGYREEFLQLVRGIGPELKTSAGK